MATMGESSSTPRRPVSRQSSQGKHRSMASGTDASPVSSSFHAPRRSVTVDEPARWRPESIDFSGYRPGDDQRRSSLFSSTTHRQSFSFSDDRIPEAKSDVLSQILYDIFTPGRLTRYFFITLPILFIVVPGCADVLFTDGSRKATDLLLLLLSSAFLYMSCTKPWDWYELTQEIKVREEPTIEAEQKADNDGAGDDQPSATAPETTKDTDKLPEKQDSNVATPENTSHPSLEEEARRRALAELHTHELLAQILIFAAPLMAASFVYSAGNQLGRPDGLVPNFGLKFFMVVAQAGTVRHVFRLLKARTLHLQRIVPVNPYLTETASSAQVQELASQLVELEERLLEVSRMATKTALTGGAPGSVNLEARLVQSVRNTIQPDLDALNRAVRRYEKKAAVLASLTEDRLNDIDGRLNDAISLSAVVARNTSLRGSILADIWTGTVERAMWTATLPLRGMLTLCMVPVRGLRRTFAVEVMDPGTPSGRRVKGYPDGGSGIKRNSSGRTAAARPPDRGPMKASGR
ncbi:hypothetical protein B0T18DRAFT_5092 [Schizothecium vesticola]|uniref:Uncharacterized protein n=1 Tax=Schizothecium vesticola TaxID=314040 RepID=A0AA40KBT7_9PEZI|nr:hypothetical protein B0T18DRAFT_5092 [Schizothecium vesticola]